MNKNAMPSANNAPADKKAREAWCAWVEKDLKAKLGKAGVLKEFIDEAINTICVSKTGVIMAVRPRIRMNNKVKNKDMPFKYFTTNKDIADWVKGKSKVRTRYGDTYPDIIKHFTAIGEASNVFAKSAAELESKWFNR